jgi:hypothetical protein
MDFWRRINGLTLALISTHDPILELGGSICLDNPGPSDVSNESVVPFQSAGLSSVIPFESVDAGSSSVDAGQFGVDAGQASVDPSTSSSLEEILHSSNIHDRLIVSPPRLVPSCNSNPAGHLNYCMFEPSDHLLICLADPVGVWDSVDQLFPLLDPPIRPERPEPIVDLVSPELPSSSNRLSRSERNLLLAQRKRAQSSHAFHESFLTKELDFGQEVIHRREPMNRGRRRVRSEVRRQKEADTALMYQQLKVQSLCAKAGWDQETLLASVTDCDPVDIAAPIVPSPVHSNLPPPPALCPVQANSSVLVNGILTGTGCQVDGSVGNQFITGGREVGSAGYMDPGSMPQSVGTSQKSNRGVSRVDQACHFTGSI